MDKRAKSANFRVHVHDVVALRWCHCMLISKDIVGLYSPESVCPDQSNTALVTKDISRALLYECLQSFHDVA